MKIHSNKIKIIHLHVMFSLSLVDKTTDNHQNQELIYSQTNPDQFSVKFI